MKCIQKPKPLKHLFNTSNFTSTLLNCFVLEHSDFKTKINQSKASIHPNFTEGAFLVRTSFTTMAPPCGNRSTGSTQSYRFQDPSTIDIRVRGLKSVLWAEGLLHVNFRARLNAHLSDYAYYTYCMNDCLFVTD